MFRWYLFRNITSDQPDFTNMSNLSEKCQRRHQASFALRDVKSRGRRLLPFVFSIKRGRQWRWERDVLVWGADRQ